MPSIERGTDAKLMPRHTSVIDRQTRRRGTQKKCSRSQCRQQQQQRQRRGSRRVGYKLEGRCDK